MDKDTTEIVIEDLLYMAGNDDTEIHQAQTKDEIGFKPIFDGK
jgi:hypothetical protein